MSGRKKAKTRLSSSDPTEKFFINMRHNSYIRHKKKWPEELDIVISTAELLKKHEQQNGRCYFTGVKYLIDGGHSPTACRICRIDTSVGFTIDNVVLCCSFFVQAKYRWSVEELKPLWKELP
jgi:hypothetical protein